MNRINNPTIQNSYQNLPSSIQSAILDAKERIVRAKKRKGKVIVTVGRVAPISMKE
jgi:hypothetical protein